MSVKAAIIVNGQPQFVFPLKGFKTNESGETEVNIADSLTGLDIPIQEYDRIQIALIVTEDAPPDLGGGIGTFAAGPEFDPGPGTDDFVFDATKEVSVTFTLQIGAADQENYDR